MDVTGLSEVSDSGSPRDTAEVCRIGNAGGGRRRDWQHGCRTGSLGTYMDYSCTNYQAFSAYATNSMTVSNNVWTKITSVNNEKFDLGGVYNASTCAFAPTLPGLYIVTFQMTIDNPGQIAGKNTYAAIYKDGSVIQAVLITMEPNAGYFTLPPVVIYDYNVGTNVYEAWGKADSGMTNKVYGAPNATIYTFFSGTRIQ